MNVNIKIIAEVLPSSGVDSIAKYSLATIQDFTLLKNVSQDHKSDMQISHHMLGKTAMQQFECYLVIPQKTLRLIYVPSSNGTQLYLQASLWMHEPFRNDNFGSPTVVTQSLWAEVKGHRRKYGKVKGQTKNSVRSRVKQKIRA